MTTEPEKKPKERIGVYVCHCGTNIAGIVDVADVATWAGEQLKESGVVISRDYKFMCSSLGQELIEKDIKEHGSDPRGRGRLFSAPARKDLPHRLQESRFEPLPVRAGLHPRAGLLGAHR